MFIFRIDQIFSLVCLWVNQVGALNEEENEVEESLVQIKSKTMERNVFIST